MNNHSLWVKVMSKKKNTEKYYRIIQAATKMFARKGFYKTRISEIAM
ncbi:MAG: TetR family transcriptional regulator, partial [Gammaproteobacteria bacterium]|nr:TetR family transcriptional regulator [Gammaproteobacteria bacterium]